MRLDWLRPLALAFSRTSLGERYKMLVLQSDINACLEAVAKHFNRPASFERSMPVLKTINGFEDLHWLFTCNKTNWGIIGMDLGEAAFLYRLVKSLRRARCLEIGRFKGGSTFLIAAALDDESRLLSVDNHTKLTHLFDGSALDASLRKALKSCGLDHKVELLVQDSSTVPLVDNSFDLVFVDGDHTYEGVSRDWQNLKRAVKPGGHVLFHDAVEGRPYATVHEGVNRLVQEIEANEAEYFVRKTSEGSLAYFVRTERPFD